MVTSSLRLHSHPQLRTHPAAQPQPWRRRRRAERQPMSQAAWNLAPTAARWLLTQQLAGMRRKNLTLLQSLKPTLLLWKCSCLQQYQLSKNLRGSRERSTRTLVPPARRAPAADTRLLHRSQLAKRHSHQPTRQLSRMSCPASRAVCRVTVLQGPSRMHSLARPASRL